MMATVLGSNYYNERRNKLIADYPDAAFIFPCAPEKIRNADVFFPYRQESNFYYVSGFEEPSSFLIVLPGGKKVGRNHQVVLFLREKDRQKELWFGKRFGLKDAKAYFEIDETHEISTLEKELPTLLKDVKRVFYTFGIHEAMDSKIINLLQQQKNLLGRSHQGLLPIFDLSLALGEMRLIKHPEEIIFQRKSCEYSARAHLELMKLVKPHMNEREAQALIDSAFMREGCQRLAYPSIVAGGSNAAYLHYVQNNQELRENDALLVDAGGEYGYYAADITRTFPIGKQFTKAQSDLYDVVFEAQKQAIDLVKPGCLIEDIQATTVGVIVEGLLNLGLLKGKKEEIIEKGEYRRFYPHRASHWLGMDVHDVGLYEIDGKSRCLEPGMVFTIEPGIYCQSYDTSVPHEFVGIGIRIEDDILVTPSGNEVLTNAAPKVRKEIEQIRSDL